MDEKDINLMTSETVEIEDNRTDNGEDEGTPFQYSISTWGADYPVELLVSRIQKNEIYIPTFQRGYVWSQTQASRFIESLLLGLPVPEIFVSKDQENKMLVIDGQQRLRTLQYFVDGKFGGNGTKFELKGLKTQFKEKTYETLSPEDKRVLNDSLIHLVVIRQEHPSDDMSSIYYVFERLNTGGSILYPQEIRSAIYPGEFRELLQKLNQNSDWRRIFGNVSKRMRDQELILRFFALFYKAEKYEEPLKGFLNKFMEDNRKLDALNKNELTDLFNNSISIIIRIIGNRAFRFTDSSTLNAAIFDSVMVSVARLLPSLKESDFSNLRRGYNELLANQEYRSLV